MTQIVLEDYHSPGLNQWQRMHWQSRRRHKQRAMDYIIAAGGNRLRFHGPVRVRYIRFREHGPPMDDDNLAGSFKVIGDALQGLGIVTNDRDITLECRQQIGRRRTVLEIEACDE